MGNFGKNDAIFGKICLPVPVKTKRMMLATEGTFSSAIDSSGRFQFPSVLVKEVRPEAEGRFVMNRSTEKCITLYPMDVWKVYRERLSRVNVFQPAMRQAYRYFMGSATEVSLDKKNRMLIPKPLAQYAELEKDLLIVCTPAFIELWNPDLYEASLQQFAANDADAMNEIANQIFGGGDFYDSLS